MSKNVCPFCKQLLPNHHGQCYYGGIKSAEHHEERAARTKLVETERLRKAIIDPNKMAIDGGKNVLKPTKKEK